MIELIDPYQYSLNDNQSNIIAGGFFLDIFNIKNNRGIQIDLPTYKCVNFFERRNIIFSLK